MLIAVGSQNPVKIRAVRETFDAATARVGWPAATVRGVAVPSGVSAMPLSDAECISGARQRAIAALAAVDATFGIGLEGGVNPEPAGLMLLGWVVAVHRDGREGVACTAKTPLPAAIAGRVLAGEELGPLMDELLGAHNTRQKGGAAAALSAGLVRRQAKFAMAVAYALGPFLAPGLYGAAAETGDHE